MANYHPSHLTDYLDNTVKMPCTEDAGVAAFHNMSGSPMYAFHQDFSHGHPIRAQDVVMLCEEISPLALKEIYTGALEQTRHGTTLAKSLGEAIMLLQQEIDQRE
jgi:hypothetical protein